MALPDPRLLLPRAADRYVGPAIALWFLAAYNVVGTARSLIHVLAPDSGAQSIATMDTSVAGGPNMTSSAGPSTQPINMTSSINLDGEQIGTMLTPILVPKLTEAFKEQKRRGGAH